MYTNPAARTWRSEYKIDPAVLELHRRLPGYTETPLRRLPDQFAQELQVGAVFFKDESSRFGLPAFKILGASWASYYAMTAELGLPSDADFDAVGRVAREKGLVLHAASEGNFGRAVARMARLLGAAAKIHVPKNMVEKTKMLIASEGAEVIVAQGNYDVAVLEATQGAKDDGGLHIQDDGKPGYEEIPDKVAEGYSTMMLEIDRQVQAAIGKVPDLVVVPVGVGSLAQATVIHFKHLDRSPFILSVEPDTAACLQTSLENGEITTVSTGNTNMCGMNCGTVSWTAWPHLSKGIDFSITVAEAEAEAALQRLKDWQIATGPCSSGTLAGLIEFGGQMQDNMPLGKDAVVVVLGTEGPR